MEIFPSKQKFETSDGVQLVYQVFGESNSIETPLIMICGLTGVKDDFYAWLPHLLGNRTILIFDNR